MERKQDWARLGRALAEAREAAGLTQVELAEEIGVSKGPIQAIENARAKRITTTMRAYARRVGWASGSIEAVLQGGDPTVETAKTTSSPTDDEVNVSRLPLRVQRALEESGEILDAQVIDLGPGQSSTRLIVVAKGKPGATQEELARALEEWSDKDLEQRGIIPPSGDDPGAAVAGE